MKEKLSKTAINTVWRFRLAWALFIILGLVGLGLGAWAVKSSREAVVVVEWSTASELNTVGFNLYRSDQPEGKLTRVNSSLIPSSPDSITGGNYSFRDPDVIPGRTYYYYLEDVDSNGAANKNGPITVKAESSAWASAIAALMLLASSGIGMVTQIRSKAANSQGEISRKGPGPS